MIDDAFKRKLFMYYVHYLYSVAVIVIVADFLSWSPETHRQETKRLWCAAEWFGAVASKLFRAE